MFVFLAAAAGAGVIAAYFSTVYLDFLPLLTLGITTACSLSQGGGFWCGGFSLLNADVIDSMRHVMADGGH